MDDYQKQRSQILYLLKEDIEYNYIDTLISFLQDINRESIENLSMSHDLGIIILNSIEFLIKENDLEKIKKILESASFTDNFIHTIYTNGILLSSKSENISMLDWFIKRGSNEGVLYEAAMMVAIDNGNEQIQNRILNNCRSPYILSTFLSHAIKKDNFSLVERIYQNTAFDKTLISLPLLITMEKNKRDVFNYLIEKCDDFSVQKIMDDDKSFITLACNTLNNDWVDKILSISNVSHNNTSALNFIIDNFLENRIPSNKYDDFNLIIEKLSTNLDHSIKLFGLSKLFISKVRTNSNIKKTSKKDQQTDKIIEIILKSNCLNSIKNKIKQLNKQDISYDLSAKLQLEAYNKELARREKEDLLDNIQHIHNSKISTRLKKI